MARKAQKIEAPKPMAERRRRHTIVEDIIDLVNKKHGVTKAGDPAEFRRRLSDYAGRHIDPQLIYGWRQRGNIPRDWIPVVSAVSGMPAEKMIQYKSNLYED